MVEPWDSASNELLRRIEAVARECRLARRSRCLLHFAWATFLVSVSLTGLLVALPSVVFPVALAYGLWMAAEGYALWLYLLNPLRKPITTEQVALFIDEHHPELENRIVTAVQIDGGRAATTSEWMVHRFLAEALPKVTRSSFRDVRNQKPFARHGVAALCMIALTLILVVLASDIWFPNLMWRRGESGGLTLGARFTVEPGNARVRRGDNLMVWVRGLNRHEKVEFRWQEGDRSWQVASAKWSPAEDVSFHEFASIHAPIQYQVMAGRVRSEVFTITPWLPAEAKSIDLTYEFPAYLDRPAREVPNSGHITAIEGTKVRLDMHANRRIFRADMVFDDERRVALDERDGLLWTTELVLARSGSYHIELYDEDGTRSEYEPEYSVRVQRDRPPEVKVAFPRGDGMVSMLEEVPFEFVVTDDFGFSEYGLEYQIVGEAPVRLTLETEGGPMMRIEGRHLLSLEDIPLEVGDLITWTVWAKDAKPGRREDELRGDPYFLEIRPFELMYREALSMAGGQGASVELLQRQREIVIATWDLRRDLGYVTPGEFAERRDVIRDNQAALQEQVQQLLMMGGPQAQLISKLLRAMADAVAALEAASLDETGKLSEAATHEQRAYQLMLKLQTADVQVGMQQQGSGGGKSRYGVEELEMSRNRNFYEEEQSTQLQEEMVDELAQKLKELARRQKLIEEEIAKLVSEMEKAKTEEDREKIRRRLERLEEEMKRNIEELDEAQQQMASGQMGNEQTQQAQQSMREAREQMNEALENIQEERLQQARAASSRAANSLRNLEDQMRQLSSGSAAKRLRQLQESLAELENRQEQVAGEVESLRDQHESPSFDGQEGLEQAQEEVRKAKEQLAEDFVELMNEAGELAERSRDSQELMSRGLGDWVRETAREGILEDIEQSQPLVKYGVWDAALGEEKKIARKLAEAGEGLERVAEKLVEDELSGMQLALSQLEELIARADELRGAKPSEESDPDKKGAGGGGEDPEERQSRDGAGEGQTPSEGTGQDNPEEERTGQGPGEGEQNATGQGGKSEDDQDAQGTGEGEKPGQQAKEQAGKGKPGERDGDKPGTSPGGASPGKDKGNSRGQAPNEAGEFRESPRAMGGGQPGEGIAERMEQFIDRDYAQWIEQLRDTESLLPRDNDLRGSVGQVRESIESWRKTWRDRALAPRYDLFVEMAGEPLREAADRLNREIEEKLGENEFLLVDEGGVPHQYRRLVADYFKNLAESAGGD